MKLKLVLLIALLFGSGHAYAQDSAGSSPAVTVGESNETNPEPKETQAPTPGAEEGAEGDKTNQDKTGEPNPFVDKVSDDPLEAVASLVSSIKNGQWRHAASFALVLVMLGIGKFRDKVSWFKGDRGGTLLVGGLALLGGLASALAADQSIDFSLLTGAIGVGLTAIGGYTGVKKLIWPSDKEGGKKPDEEATE